MDAGTAAGVLARFAGDPAGAHYVIGAWTHGGERDVDVFDSSDAPAVSRVEEQNSSIFAFLAPHLKPDSGARPPANGLTYFTMGEKRWKHTLSWPIAGSGNETWFLAAAGELRTDAPAQTDGMDSYLVDYSAGTGSTTRWTTQLGGGNVFYGDRREADSILPTYTSPPLDEDLEITGHPLVRLYVASTHDDGAVIAYLEAVSPDGRVLMISEGELRLIHRAASADEPPYPMFGPHHTFERRHAAPMAPGEVAEIAFALLPTSVRVPRGYALRLAVAGHDRDSFCRYPAEGTPTLNVHRSSRYPSSLTLPTIRTRRP